MPKSRISPYQLEERSYVSSASVKVITRNVENSVNVDTDSDSLR